MKSEKNRNRNRKAVQTHDAIHVIQSRILYSFACDVLCMRVVDTNLLSLRVPFHSLSCAAVSILLFKMIFSSLLTLHQQGTFPLDMNRTKKNEREEGKKLHNQISKHQSLLCKSLQSQNLFICCSCLC